MLSRRAMLQLAKQMMPENLGKESKGRVGEREGTSESQSLGSKSQVLSLLNYVVLVMWPESLLFYV